MQETWIQSLGREDPLERNDSHSIILAWEILWREEPGLQFMESQELDMT